MIPHYFQSYVQHIPLLQQFSNWQQLKAWDLAAVYRVHHADRTYIVKWGGHEMKDEGKVYVLLLNQLALPSPRLIAYITLYIFSSRYFTYLTAS